MEHKNSIPGPGFATDGVSRLPGRRITKHRNWPELMRLFLADAEYSQVYTWLMESQHFTLKEIKSGYTQKMVKGWSGQKAVIERKKTEAAISQMLEEQRKRMPSLMAAKLNLVAKVMGSVNKWDQLLPADKKLIYEILKNELGEPTKITNLGIGPAPKDPVEALLEEYGLMREGRIFVNAETSQPAAGATEQAEGPGDNVAVEAANSGPPAEIPQN